MTILGIETATSVCAVALWQDGRLLAELRYDLKNLHAEIITGLVDTALKTCHLQPADLDGIAVSKGPGSFTGLRIGMAFAKGMAFAHNLPIAGIATPDGIASGIPPLADRLVVALPSRKNEIYAAPYRALDGYYHREGKIVSLETAEFSRWAGNAEWVAGPGIDALRAAGIGGRRYVPPIFWCMSAAPIAWLGARKILAGDVDDLGTLEPEYVKDFHTVAKPSPAGMVNHGSR